jgi:tetratricopeptide (TPR) repeat protein
VQNWPMRKRFGRVRLTEEERRSRGEDLRRQIATARLSGIDLANRADPELSLRTVRYFLSGKLPSGDVLIRLEEAARRLVEEQTRISVRPGSPGRSRLGQLLDSMEAATPKERGRELEDRLVQAAEHAARDIVGYSEAADRAVEAVRPLVVGLNDRCITLASRVAAQDSEIGRWACWMRANAVYLKKGWHEAYELALHASQAETPATVAWSYWLMGKVHDKRGQYQLATRALRKAQRLAPDISNPWERADLLGWTHWALAWIALSQGQLDESATLLARVQDAAPVEDYNLHIWLLHGIGKLQIYIGNLGRARQDLREGAWLCRAIANEHALAWMDWGIAEISAMLEAYADAAAFIDRACGLLMTSAGPNAPSLSLARSLGLLCRGALGEIRWSQVADEIRQWRELETDIEYSAAISTLLLFEGEARRHAGQLDQSTGLFATALERGQRKVQPTLQADAFLGLGFTGLEGVRRGRNRSGMPSRQEAIAHLRSSMALYERFGARWGILQSGLALRSLGQRISISRLQRVDEYFPRESAALDLDRRDWNRLLTFPGPAG